MQKMLGYMRKAIQEFGLIQDGDRVAVGVSGGKDSLVLLKGLVMLKRFIGIDYDVVAITLDPGFGGVWGDYSSVQVMCDDMGVPYVLKRTQIGEIVFDIRKETNPCSLCAKMRRGALHDAAKEAGCNKIALGHHYNDAVETFVMNLFHEGRVGCFSPLTYLSKKEIFVIRPMVFAPENAVKRAAKHENLQIVKSKCPADGHTSRERAKDFLAERERDDKGFTDRIFGAMRRSGVSGWGETTERKVVINHEVCALLYKAKQACTANYCEGDLAYTNICHGASFFVGQEIITKIGSVIFATSYSGRVLSETFSASFLQDALSKVSKDAPFRGPRSYSQGEFLYICVTHGGEGFFSGKEEIFCGDDRVYEGNFYGGEII